MEKAPENGNESSHSAHTKGMNEFRYVLRETFIVLWAKNDSPCLLRHRYLSAPS
jgi:hypothetical protein